MSNSWWEIIKNNFNMKFVLTLFILGILVTLIILIAFPKYIILLILIIFYSGLIAGLLGGGKVYEGIVNGAISGFSVPFTVFMIYLIHSLTNPPIYANSSSDMAYYVIASIFITLLVLILGAFGGFLGIYY